MRPSRGDRIAEALRERSPTPPPLPTRDPPVPICLPGDTIEARGTTGVVLQDDGENVRARRCSDGVIKNFSESECKRVRRR